MTRRPSEQALHLVFPAQADKILLGAVTVLAVLALLLGGPPALEADVITSGLDVVDSELAASGEVVYLLSAGASTVSVVDTATDEVIGVYYLGQAADTCRDVDVREAWGRPLIGTSTGKLLALNPSSSQVVTLKNAPGSDYSVMTADDWDSGAVAWIAEGSGDDLLRLSTTMTLSTEAALPTGTPVEMKEMPDGAAEEEKVVVLGKDGSDLWLLTHDRDTDASDDVALSNLTPTGLATAGPEYAYVTANDANGDGHLLRADVAPLAFDSSPVGSWTDTAALDVATAGPWINVVLVPDGEAETTVYVFDGGDAANPVAAGSILINPTYAAAGGFSAGGAGTSLDDLYFVCGLVDEDAFAARTAEMLGGCVYASPANAAGDLPSGTDAASYVPAQEALPTQCASQEPFGRGLVETPTPLCGTDHQVMFATGEEVFVLPLVQVPGVGIDLPIELCYRSRIDYDGPYGRGWTLNQDVRLEATGSGDQVYHNGYGRRDTFLSVGGGAYASPTYYDSTLTVGTTSTLTNRFGVTSTFTSGQRTEVEDRFGNTVTYTWTGDLLTGITDTLGHAYTLSYGSDGRLSSITDHASRTWTLAYDHLGRLRSVTMPASATFSSGRTTRFSYAPNHADARFRDNLVQVWSATGALQQSLVYDADDMVVQESVGSSSWTIAYTPSSTQLLAEVEDRSGNVTEWRFNVAGMPTRERAYTRGLRTGEPTYFETQYEVGTNGLIEAVVMPRGNRSEYTYSGELDLLEVRHKTTNTTSDNTTDLVQTWEYGAYSQVSEATDPRGNVTTFTLDSLGRTTAIDRPTVTSPATQTITETFEWDARGRLTLARDGEGREVALEYYTTGASTGWLQAVVKDPDGLALRTEFTYTAVGGIASITDPRGSVTTITLDEEGYPTELEAPAPLSFRRRFEYDLARRVTKVEVENLDADGTADATTPWIETNLSYDAIGRLVARKVDLTPTTTATTTYEYEGSGRVSKITRPEGDETSFTWDERGLLFQRTRGLGTAAEATDRWDYDANGNLATYIDGRGHATTYESDPFDRLIEVTDALGAYTTLEYDQAGNRTAIEAYDDADALVAKTVQHFDAVNRLWKVVRHRFGSGLTTTYPETVITRDRGHLVTQVEDPEARVSYRTYDAVGRLVGLEDAVGDTVEYTLDENGNVTRVEETEVPDVGSPETFATEFDYDVANRVVEKREIDRTSSSNVLTTTFRYDSRSNLTFRLDAENHPVRWAYDLASRLVTYERALSTGTTVEDFVTQITEAFQFDTNDRLVTLVDDNFSETAYEYDALDRSTKTTYEDAKYVTRTFDDEGNVVGWVDQNGTEVENTYDDLNRLVAREVTRGTGVEGTTAEAYSYDALGRLLTAVDDDYQVERTWDSLGNLLQERQGYTASGNERWKTVASTYGAAGARTSITYPSAFALTLVRDDLDRMTALHDATNTVDVATFAWQGASRLAATTNQNGTSTEYAWDGFRRLATIDHQLSGGGSLHKMEYLYDRAHNRRMEKNSFDATWLGGLPSAVQTFLGARDGKGDVYAYDMAYRMVDARYDVANPTSEVATPGSQTYGRLVQYTLDGLGNRSQTATTPPTPAATVTYAFDGMNQYTAIGGVSRTHDDNGNVTDDGTYLWVYDYRNLVVEVQDKGRSATIATYRYDALGRRVEKDVSGGATTRYLLDGVEVIEEVDGSNVWQARYLYEDGIDRPRAMDRADQADVDGDSNTTEVLRFHYHQQALGSVTELTAPGGAVVEWVVYDAYGQPTVRDRGGSTVSASAVGNPFLFTGREWDPENGTFHYRARTYDPAVGRFLQCDPIGSADGPSAYEFVHSDPVGTCDPMGLQGEPSSGQFARQVNLKPPPAPVPLLYKPSMFDSFAWEAPEVQAAATNYGRIADRAEAQLRTAANAVDAAVSAYLAALADFGKTARRVVSNLLKCRLYVGDLRDLVAQLMVVMDALCSLLSAMNNFGALAGVANRDLHAATAGVLAAVDWWEQTSVGAGLDAAAPIASVFAVVASVFALAALAAPAIVSAVEAVYSRLVCAAVSWEAAVAGGATGGSTYVAVSRWGRAGLQPGDWIMKGRASWLNWVLSGKCGPSLFGNIHSPRVAGVTYFVPRTSIGLPNMFNPVNWIKAGLGQRRYRP